MSATATAVQQDAFRTFSEIEGLIQRFEAKTLPRAEWTHQAHLAVACWYLVCHPEAEAIRRIRSGILAYNEAHGVITTKERGYHETMTLFWAKMIRHFLSSSTLDCSLVTLFNELLARYDDKNLPFTYYSRSRLLSWEARSDWVAPDIRPLP